MKDIVIKGAREHNLKDISITLPRDKFIVISGLSGSGKSTLAFDTIYAEGQRRYVESLSAYARQFLGVMSKPDVDSIEGLSPAISIDQKTTSKNPRSTVGTITEVYDYLRLLYARIGIPYCPIHNIEIKAMSPQKIGENIVNTITGNVIVLAPIIRQKKGTYEQLIKDLNKDGYNRVRINGKIERTDEKVTLDRYKKHNIDIVIDRVDTKEKSRLNEAIENAIAQTKDLVIISYEDENGNSKEKTYSSKLACPTCGLSFEELEPRMFSFNSPFGACEECHGLGVKMEIDSDLLIPDKNLSIIDGAIAIYGKLDLKWRSQQLKIVGDSFGFDLFTPIKDFTKKQIDALLYGSSISLTGNWSNGASMNMNEGFEGVIPQTMRLYKQTESDKRRKEIEKYIRTVTCPSCNGARLKKKVLSVKIDGNSIIEVTDLSIKESLKFFKNFQATKKELFIAKQILKEINSRLEFLNNVGLSYLSLSRKSGTLSGGEAQRIRLATQIGSNLMGVLYVLDEPSIGLHQRDNKKLIKTLHRLRDIGNSLIVVEHDEETIFAADYVVDIGPGAGIHGGKIIAKGSPKEICKNKKSLTGKYLSGEIKIDIPKTRRVLKDFIHLNGCTQNNLKNVNLKIPLGVLSGISGVSGSGKSTIIYDTLYKAMMNKLHGSRLTPGKHSSLKFDSDVDKIIVIDQSPIGKTPRSNPATYVKVFDEIRKLFSETKEAKIRGYKPGRFSFNVKGGRCEACQGDGVIKIEMNFLADVYVECEECNGKRYNHETLKVRYKGKNIANVLDMSIEEACILFEKVPNIYRKLETLVRVGLEYIKLGQSSTTLSGGEAQRIKLTRELAKRSTGKTLYFLDEPTTGLHFHDVKKLIKVLNDLVDKGNSIVVIEHNLDVLKSCDHIIDLGPDGGDMGGTIVAQGTPEYISKNKKSYTGQYLKDLLTCFRK